MWNEHNFTELIGKTFTKVENLDNEELVFTMPDGNGYRFYHSQDCCESVTIDDIIGDLSDLESSPITMAEVVTHENENPDSVSVPDYQDSFTWTFYKFATVKGYVTVRWYGESNGYYSEEVDFTAF